MDYYLLTEDSMVDRGSPTMRRRQLGLELRRLREAAGKTQEDAGEWLGLPASSISKIENGKQRVTRAYLKLLSQLYEVQSPHLDALELLRRESDQRGWWVSYGKSVPTWFLGYIGTEAAAAEIWTYEAEFIPGLLQTPAYTEAINLALSPDRAPQEIERIVQIRESRQRRLTDGDPLILRAVINQAALRREVGGGGDLMRTQVQRIVEVAHLPNVTMQVLPFAAGAHRGMRGPFTALRFPEEGMNTIYIELEGAALYLESPSEVSRYTSTFEGLAARALDPEASLELLVQICKAKEIG